MKASSFFRAAAVSLSAALAVACGSSDDNSATGTGGASDSGGSGGQGNGGTAGTSTGGSNAGAANGGRSNAGGTSGGGTNAGGTIGSGGGAGASSGGGAGAPSGGSSSGGTGNGGSSGSGSGGAFDSGGTSSYSVLQRGRDLFRQATYTAPDLTVAAAKTMAPDATFDQNATFPANGSTENQGTASVLYLQEGPTAAGCPANATGCKATARAAGGGLYFAFPALGADPNVVAFDETTGLTVWTAHVQTGGDGIRSTPVIDPTSRRLFVVTGGNPHLVHALSVDDGTEVTSGGWPVTISSSTVSFNGTNFNSGGQNQHGASLLMNDILYIPFGGQYGDGGTYRGWVVAVDITNPSRIAGWATRSPRSGIWASGGLAADGAHVFAVTGDTTSQPRNQSDSEEVLRLSGLAEFTRDAASVFVPTEWQSWDRPAGDLDFGSSSPAFVQLPAGSNPSTLLVAPAKAGRLFILDGGNLSAGSYPTPGGALAELTVANTSAESVYTAPTIYRSASGLHATINVGVGPANCPGGNPPRAAIISTLIEPGKTPIATEVWCAGMAGGGHTNSAPISTTSDGASADAMVWFMNGAQLEAVDGDSGQVVFTTTGANCDSVPSMSFPIAVKNRIVVSALGHLCSWSPNGT